MPAPRQTVIIELWPTRRQLTVLRAGQVVDFRIQQPDTTPAPLASQPQAPGIMQNQPQNQTRETSAATSGRWSHSLTDFEQTLATWVHELALTGSPATVVYSSPDSAASVFSCPSAAGTASALRAAQLALAESISYPLESAAHDAALITTDCEGTTDAGGTSRLPQIHHLVASDRDASASAICDCVTSAGLVPVRLIPSSAAILHAAASLAIQPGSDQTCNLVLWIGEHGSALAAGNERRLAFVRFLPIGTETFAEALARPLQTKKVGMPCVLLDRTAAHDLLFSSGIPVPQQPGEAPLGIDPAFTIPLIRPVQQKFAVETKQSLRFNLSPRDREGLKLTVAGPGASIRHLAAAIAHDIGLELHAASADTEPLPPARQGDLDAVLLAGSSVNLLPQSRKAAINFSRIRRALWVGIGAAAFAIAADGLVTRHSLGEQIDILARLQHHAANPDPTHQALLTALCARQGVTQAEHRIRQRLAHSPDAAALLALLAEQTTEPIRLHSIELAFEQGVWVARVTGFVGPSDDPETAAIATTAARTSATTSAATRVKEFVDRLALVPIVSHARLGPTQLDKSQGSGVLNFDVSLTLVGLPLHSDLEGAMVDVPTTGLPEITGGRP